MRVTATDEVRSEVAKMGDAWYGAKTLYRIDVRSTIKHRWSLVEERVVIISAPDDNSACDKALDEAESYGGVFFNHSGEEIEWRFLGRVDCFRINADHLVNGIEVFSQVIRVRQSATDESIVERLLPNPKRGEESARERLIIDVDKSRGKRSHPRWARRR